MVWREPLGVQTEVPVVADGHVGAVFATHPGMNPRAHAEAAEQLALESSTANVRSFSIQSLLPDGDSVS